jgi:hypothetical protein
MASRAFDLIAATLGLVVLSPLFLVVAIAIKMGSPGPVFFRQERVGRGGVPFRMHKFRSMRPDAEKLGGPLTVGADPRITRVGAFLRATKLDELPQLIDVVKGDMALVRYQPRSASHALLDRRGGREADVALRSATSAKVAGTSPGLHRQEVLDGLAPSVVLEQLDQPHELDRRVVADVVQAPRGAAAAGSGASPDQAGSGAAGRSLTRTTPSTTSST